MKSFPRKPLDKNSFKKRPPEKIEIVMYPAAKIIKKKPKMIIEIDAHLADLTLKPMVIRKPARNTTRVKQPATQ
jgi:hypothetical protein